MYYKNDRRGKSSVMGGVKRILIGEAGLRELKGGGW